MPKLEKFARVRTAFENKGQGYYKAALNDQSIGKTNWNRCSDRLHDFKEWILYIPAMSDRDPEKKINLKANREMEKWLVDHTTVVHTSDSDTGFSYVVREVNK